MKKLKLIIAVTSAVIIMTFTCFAIVIFGDTSNFDHDKTYFCPGACIREQGSQ